MVLQATRVRKCSQTPTQCRGGGLSAQAEALDTLTGAAAGSQDCGGGPRNHTGCELLEGTPPFSKYTALPTTVMVLERGLSSEKTKIPALRELTS